MSRTSGDLTLDVVRVGLSYKLDRDPFAPDAARFAGRTPITKAPARVAVPWTWAGYYIGAHAGYGWGRGNEPFDSRLLPTGVPVSGVNSNGFVAGFQAGANWQSSSVVGGLEIDLAGAGIKGSGSTATLAVDPLVLGTAVSQAAQTDKFDRLGSARARLGYLVSPDMLLYGTGGLGWTRFVHSHDHRDGYVGGHTALAVRMGGRRRSRNQALAEQLARPRRIPALRLRRFRQLHPGQCGRGRRLHRIEPSDQ